VFIDEVPYRIVEGLKPEIQGNLINARVNFISGIVVRSEEGKEFLLNALEPGMIVIVHDVQVREGSYRTSAVAEVFGVVGPDMTVSQSLSHEAELRTSGTITACLSQTDPLQKENKFSHQRASLDFS